MTNQGQESKKGTVIMKKLSVEINKQLLELLDTLDKYDSILPRRKRKAIIRRYEQAMALACSWELFIPKDCNGDLAIETEKDIEKCS